MCKVTRISARDYVANFDEILHGVGVDDFITVQIFVTFGQGFWLGGGKCLGFSVGFCCHPYHSLYDSNYGCNNESIHQNCYSEYMLPLNLTV